MSNDSAIDPPTSRVMIPRDQAMGNFPPKASLSQAIFKPTNTSTRPKPAKPKPASYA